MVTATNRPNTDNTGIICGAIAQITQETEIQILETIDKRTTN